ncbi:Dam family site-specific DNA-(adenine-N6)-methyltransferase [Spiroplasma endosymbiont of Cantharis rufa]|uniref:DNA adenine methylase n=1 Tax=Spiroplasma endosymbiont of Cantharis rufa TaxID=3066279 RepID=UPI0030CE164D
MAKPILKWVGGKTQIINEIKNEFPNNFNNYFELFIGGGALTFDMLNSKTIINDLNSEVINLYLCIRDNYESVVDYIENFRIKYNKSPEKFYYKLRSYEEKYFEKNKFMDAARTLFLNKTCFNGLFRKNSKDEFNVPWNKKIIAPKIYDIDNIIIISNFLKKINIQNKSFEYFKNKIKKGDLVYLDPPYDKLNNSTFEAYNKDSFGKEGQIALKEFCDFINEIGAKFILSNHDTTFIKEIYKKYNIKIIRATRMVNSKSSGRGKINELLIKNF